MGLTTTQLISQFVLKFLVASLVSAASYFLCRFLASKWRSIIPISLLLIVLLLFNVKRFSFLGFQEFKFIFMLSIFSFVVLPIPCIVGGLFHQRVDGNSITKGQSQLLLFSASFLSVFAALLANWHQLIFLFDPYTDILYFLGAMCFPSMVPILVLVWRNMTLRPGTDKHLDS